MLLGLLTGCSSLATTASEMELRRLRPEAPAYVQNSSFAVAANQIIRTQNEWDAAWNQVAGRQRPVPQQPAVDFRREMVILAALGQQRSGGHAVRIVALEKRGPQLVVRVRTESPGKGCLVASAITSPVDIALVPATDADIQFAVEAASIDCEAGQ